MNTRHAVAIVAALAAAAVHAQSAPAPVAAPTKPRTTSEVLAATTAADWRPLDPEHTLYLQVPAGRVVIELAPAFAPLHAANLRTLVRQKYFDGLAIIRSQDNFVVQWGDPADRPRPLGNAQAKVPPEFTVRLGPAIPFEPIPDRDGYAPEVGFSQGFPAARDTTRGEAWLTHCYGMVGAGRGNEPDSGNGTELYVVTGHAPRQLDRNIALVGRVVQGMELLSTLPRGSGPLGFYEKPAQHVPLTSIRLAADLPAAERVPLEVLRTDTASFRALVEARRNRRDDWYLVPAGYVDICNIPIVARTPP
ncbi:MAG TPA: peptidylprolyl isomerase [Steroidobacteraceae bacterium]|nr:peptidylprolyl isomerase [Steroidobacteraceae bacterium]